jgi:hypothetical protein
VVPVEVLVTVPSCRKPFPAELARIIRHSVGEVF